MRPKIKRNPIRRNRNIGTAKQGHGDNNCFVLPGANNGPAYWAKMENAEVINHNIGEHKFCILIEPPNEGFAHACTVGDVITILSNIPEKDRLDIAFIILRQPRKKEEILRPVWGRFLYWMERGKHAGAAIILSATSLEKSFRWDKSLSPFYEKELQRLKEDGHIISSDNRFYKFKSSLEAVRNTQLYRTIPHEIGHLVDALRQYDGNWQNVSKDEKKKYMKNYFSPQTHIDKEAFAHRYSENFRKEMSEKGTIPFTRII